MRDYSPALLDELLATGEVTWSGAGSISGSDGWIALHPSESAPLTLQGPADIELGEAHRAILDVLAGGGGYFFRQLATDGVSDAELKAAVWELVWAGWITGDTFAPVAVAAEGVAGGFATLYKVLSTFEDAGRCQRGYFIESLGGAQFAVASTVDRLRGFADPIWPTRTAPRCPGRRRARTGRWCWWTASWPGSSSGADGRCSPSPTTRPPSTPRRVRPHPARNAAALTMPEGDTVWHTAAVLREHLLGETLTRCDIRVPRFATVDLTGQVVDEILSRGKHLFIRVGAASIHSHLKMEGSWRVGPRVRVDHRARIVLETGAATAVGVDLGVLQILDRDRDGEAVAHLGPDLLGEDWDPANLAARPQRPIAEALLDQRVLAGIGNVYCNELCFVSGHLPTTPVSAVADPRRLVSRARDMLWLNRFRWNRCTTGDTRNGRQLWVYGRAGQPCRRCGTPIEFDDSGDRVTYWCPSCQR